MLQFVDYSYEQLKAHIHLIKRNPFLCNDISVGSIFIWSQGVDFQFAVYHNTLILKETIGDQTVFSYPFGDDAEGALSELKEYVKTADTQLMFFGVPEELLEEMKSDKQYHSIHANYDRRWSDYLYDFEEMVNFSGKKFSGQRNHINRFTKSYGAPDFREITADNIDQIKAMLTQYHKEHGEKGLEEEEYLGSISLLEHFHELEMYGGALYVDDQVVGFTIGEILGNMFIIHVEKALTAYSGVYPTLFNSFMKYMKSITQDTITLVNREDDCGDLGLRTSKTQYHPIRLLHKYMVTIDSPAIDMSHDPIISFDGGYLSTIRESDKSQYFALCTDQDNNKYWGYDYENDRSMTVIDEDSFFNSQAYDMSLGASINFAVRQANDNTLIGETIIYHFTADGYAEIGGRIAKSHQGKGLGRNAFSATADFAEQSMHLKVRARCYKENIPSYKMITSSGFHQTREDETFFYFER